MLAINSNKTECSAWQTNKQTPKPPIFISSLNMNFTLDFKFRMPFPYICFAI